MVGSSELLQRPRVPVGSQHKTFSSPLIFFELGLGFGFIFFQNFCCIFQYCIFWLLWPLMFSLPFKLFLSFSYFWLSPSQLLSVFLLLQHGSLPLVKCWYVPHQQCWLLPLMLFQYLFLGVTVWSERSDQPPCCEHLVVLLTSEVIRGKRRDKIREQEDASMTVGQLEIMNERLAVRHCMSIWSQKIAILRRLS